LQKDVIPIQQILQSLQTDPPLRVSGTAVFMTKDPHGMPTALLLNLKHNKVLHERVLILNSRFADVPHVADRARLKIKELGPGFYRVTVRYGFMDNIAIPQALDACSCGTGFDMMDTTFFYGRENIIPTRGTGMAIWREHLFATLARSAASPMTFLRIPANRVVELGVQVEI
jgi:KUP system potassium uptake protein